MTRSQRCGDTQAVAARASLPSALVRHRLSVFLVVLCAPAWMPWVFAAPVGETTMPAVERATPTLVGSMTAALPRMTPTTRAAQPAPTSPSPPSPQPRPAIASAFGTARLTARTSAALRPRASAPALAADFPDPDVLRVGATWWGYATGTGFAHLQVRSSPDLSSWSAPADALPLLPGWASPGYSWAPAVTASGSGYLMYYSVRDARNGRQCLSVATSTTPAGPFSDVSVVPLTCQTGSGGSIDPQPFTAPDGTRYLLWKSEDNALGLASRIGVQRLSPDGLSLLGDRPRLLTATFAWQAGVIEGPSMIAIGRRFYLFYGANRWNTARAGIGYAVCDTPVGPCADGSRDRPWLASTPGAIGPSGPDAFIGPDGRAWIAYHAWSGEPGATGDARQLWIEPLAVVNGVPLVG